MVSSPFRQHWSFSAGGAQCSGIGMGVDGKDVDMVLTEVLRSHLSHQSHEEAYRRRCSTRTSSLLLAEPTP